VLKYIFISLLEEPGYKRNIHVAVSSHPDIYIVSVWSCFWFFILFCFMYRHYNLCKYAVGSPFTLWLFPWK